MVLIKLDSDAIREQLEELDESNTDMEEDTNRIKQEIENIMNKTFFSKILL